MTIHSHAIWDLYISDDKGYTSIGFRYEKFGGKYFQKYYFN